MTPGIKFDHPSAAKPRYSLIPWRALQSILAVLEHGAVKYTHDVPDASVPGGVRTVSGADNWRTLEDLDRRYYDAAMRHLSAWRCGELADPDTGLPHLAHLGACVLFLLSKQVGYDGPVGAPAGAAPCAGLAPSEKRP